MNECHYIISTLNSDKSNTEIAKGQLVGFMPRGNSKMEIYPSPTCDSIRVHIHSSQGGFLATIPFKHGMEVYFGPYVDSIVEETTS